MTSALRASARHWLAGLALATTGVLATRVAAPGIDATRLRAAVAFIGELVALAGLGVIMIGIRRRVRRAEAALAASSANPSSN